MKKCFLVLFTVFSTGSALAQDSLSDLLSLSIEKLMDIPIYSASKSEETMFDAPLASSVLTREQIKRAGCTSIMDALRLVPGVIVREQTNGNYDIHIRGLDNIPPNSSLIFFTNSTTLVMIDNRPAYNYLHGGTFWETLPIALNDVERIEVVRGPSAALYGPNAVSGVINIITAHPQKKGTYASAMAQYGSYNTLVSGAALGYKPNDKFDAIVSGNFSRRDRTQSDYYDIARDSANAVTNPYVPLDSVTAIKNNPLHNTSVAYPNPERSLWQYAANAFLTYKPIDKTTFSLDLGLQQSEAQKEFGSGLMPITTATSNTKYADFKASIYDLNLQISHQYGSQSPVLGQKIWQWDLNTTEAVAEYNYKQVKNLVIIPGIMYRTATYDDSKYVNTSIHEGLWSGQATTETKAAYLRFDYRMLDKKLRLIAAGRIDKFNYPDKAYFSYQLAATYKIDQNNLVRIVQARANRTPLLIDLFSNLDITGPLPTLPGHQFLLQIRGDKNIRLLTSDLTGMGYRSKINENLAIDLELFYNRVKDFSDLVVESATTDTSAPVAFTALVDINNLTVRAHQLGATLTIDYADGPWEIKPFITVQHTNLLDYSPYANSPAAPPTASNKFNPAVYNLYSNAGTTIDHQATPTLYGGCYINWKANDKLNCNVNAYFFSDQTQLEANNLTYHDGSRGVENVDTKLLLNAVIQYKVLKQLTAMANFRNCLNARGREFYKGDAPAFMALAGLNFEL